MELRALIGSGDKIGKFFLPFFFVGLLLNIFYPSAFYTGSSWVLFAVALGMLVGGLVIWGWSVYLILKHVPQKKLITWGPYAIVRHPLYTGVSLLVLPALGFLLNTWLGLLLGIALYLGSRLYSPEEEDLLETMFGAAWQNYRTSVKIPWL